MQTRLNPYLSFRSNAREVMSFYQSVFGGSLQVNTFKDVGASQGADEDDLVMHAMLEAENGVTVMASDTPPRMELQPGSTVSLSLSGDNEAELRGYWEKLSEKGTITMPLDKAMWGDTFGMCTDRFGISWLVNISSGS